MRCFVDQHIKGKKLFDREYIIGCWVNLASCFPCNSSKVHVVNTFQTCYICCRFVALLDNYKAATGVSEEVTPEEVKENRDFIDAIMETKVMKRTHEYLATCGKAPNHVGEFKRYIYDIWFKLYRRTKGSRALDSSGFEHVFVGETRDKEPIGFHNWIQFYLEEKAGKVDYQGYIQSHKVSVTFKQLM